MKKAMALSVLCGVLLSGCANGSNERQMGFIGEQAALSTAFSAAGLTGQEVETSNAVLSKQNGVDYYLVGFSTREKTYSYDIDALTGVVIEKSEMDIVNDAQKPHDALSAATAQAATPAEAATGDIGEERAKAIALEHAGVSQEQVAFMKMKRKVEDGVLQYDVDFYNAEDFAEYDYSIRASDGEILNFDRDMEQYTAADAAQPAGKLLSQQQVLEIAVSKIRGAALEDVTYQCELDMDDGRQLYEGSIYYEQVEYEFEIDAYSGAIVSWEADRMGR